MSPPAAPDIDLFETDEHVRVHVADRRIADTRAAVTLQEGGLPPVRYIPHDDVDMRFLQRSATRTRCPHKGEATWFHVVIGGLRLENAAWSYEAPLPAVDAIRDRLAFYPDRVELHVR